jgi:predicted regulator of Ras-like GTPase activity (Roadblock/LC7/MglB family)
MSEANHAGSGVSRSAKLDQILAELVGQVPEVEAAAVVSFDGLAMAAALPAGMDEDRVAAMSAALLSLGERAAEGLGRGELSQIYVEGENGTVFLISADDEAVLVAVASRGAKVGLMLFEVRRAAASVADALRVETAPSLVPVARVEHAPGHVTDEHSDHHVEERLDDVPPLQFVTKNGWGQPESATPAETTSWT